MKLNPLRILFALLLTFLVGACVPSAGTGDPTDPSTSTTLPESTTSPTTIASTTIPVTSTTVAPTTTSTTIPVTTTTTTIPTSSANLFANGDIEAGSGPTATSWTHDGYGTNTATAAVTSSAHGGSRALTLTITGFTGEGDHKWIPAPVAVTPGTTYAFADFYQSTATTQLDVVYTNAAGVDSYFWLADLAPASSWTQANASFTVPAGITKATVYHILSSNGSLTIDDVSLRAGTSTGTTTTTTMPTTTVPSTTTTTVPTTGHAPFSSPVVSFEFDDNWMSGYTLGLPIMKSFGYTPINYVITDTVKNCEANYMCAAQVKDWVAQGGEIGSHTVDHHSLSLTEPDGKVLTQAQVVKELTDSKSYLTTLLGKAPALLATPYCESNAFVTATAKTLYQGMRNCDDPTNTAATWDPYNIHSISIENTTTVAQINAILTAAKASKGWVVITFHEVSSTHSADQYTSSTAEMTTILNAVKASGIEVTSTSKAFARAQGLG